MANVGRMVDGSAGLKRRLRVVGRGGGQVKGETLLQKLGFGGLWLWPHVHRREKNPFGRNSGF